MRLFPDRGRKEPHQGDGGLKGPVHRWSLSLASRHSVALTRRHWLATFMVRAAALQTTLVLRGEFKNHYLVSMSRGFS